MPFGKHKGQLLDELPIDYLEWLLTIELRPLLAAAVRGELQRRRHAEADADAVARHNPSPAIVDELVGAGVKVLAKRYHPDLAGGDAGKMVAVSHAADWLRACARAVAEAR